LAPTHWQRIGTPHSMKALRPVASRLGLRSSTARRGKPLRKRNATTQAVGGNLGGFCVSGARMVTQRTTTPKEPEGLIMFGTEPWGYGGYGQFHMVVWIILAIAAVAGVVWRLRSGSS